MWTIHKSCVSAITLALYRDCVSVLCQAYSTRMYSSAFDSACWSLTFRASLFRVDGDSKANGFNIRFKGIDACSKGCVVHRGRVYLQLWHALMVAFKEKAALEMNLEC